MLTPTLFFTQPKVDKNKIERKRFFIRYVVTEYVFNEKRYFFTFSDYEWTLYLLPKKGNNVKIVCHLPVLKRNCTQNLPHVPKGIRGWFKKQITRMLVWIANKQSRYVFNGVAPIYSEKVKERVVTDALVNGQLSDVFVENRLFVFFGVCVIWRNRFLHKKALDTKALHSTSKNNKRKDTVELVDMPIPAKSKQNFSDYT